jgi:hypothetical protein
VNQWLSMVRGNGIYRIGLHAAFVVGVMAWVIGAGVPTGATGSVPQAARPAADPSGLHDFDFLAGEWRTHHRRLKERLVSSHEWVEFDGTLSTRLLMGGWANSGDNFFDVPGGAYRGVSLRSYDSKTGQWAIWWLDGRDPFGALDPPLKGRFTNGGANFYADDTFKGKAIRVRYIWSRITPSSAHWEQAYSVDGGKTWETNWITDFTRVRSIKL